MNQEYYGAFPRIASLEIRNYESAAALYEGDADVMLCFDDNVIRYAKRAGYSVCQYTDGLLDVYKRQAFYKVSEKIYKQNPGAAGTDPGQQGGPQGGDDTVVDADYTVVDDDDSKK